MALSEQWIWRAMIAALIGLGAAAVATVLDSLRKDPKVPIAAGLSASVTAFAIDWYTERQHGG